MPTNKNALIRYRIIDELLADSHRRYTRQDLFDIVSRRMLSLDNEFVISKRTIEKDLIALQERPFEMEIIEEVGNGKRFVRYADQSQSLFTRPLSKDEMVLLREVLNTLGQFSGLDNFDWLDALQERLNDPDSFGEISDSYPIEPHGIISFSKNPYLNNRNGVMPVQNALYLLFSAISSCTTVTVDYLKFGEEEPKTFIVFPYLLKQYNDRWYLICSLLDADPEFIMNLPLDRMAKVDMVPQITYRPCTVDLEDRFSKIIGVTYRYDLKETKIIFAISENKKPYIQTKPIHETQREFIEEEQREWRERYPGLAKYRFFEIECIPNNELMECFFSYDKEIVVISPESIRKDIMSELQKQNKLYFETFSI